MKRSRDGSGVQEGLRGYSPVATFKPEVALELWVGDPKEPSLLLAALYH
jgi:hypothetical protein